MHLLPTQLHLKIFHSLYLAIQTCNLKKQREQDGNTEERALGTSACLLCSSVLPSCSCYFFKLQICTNTFNSRFHFELAMSAPKKALWSQFWCECQCGLASGTCTQTIVSTHCSLLVILMSVMVTPVFKLVFSYKSSIFRESNIFVIGIL